MTALDPRAALHAALSFACKNLVNDLHALTEEQAADASRTGTRSAVAVVAECAAVNGSLATFVSTGTFPASPSPEERDAFYAAITTRAQALAALESSTQQMRDAIDARSADTWGDVAESPFGGPTTVFSMAEFAAMHMMYHDGQLNYLHTLHGDPEMHW